MKGQVSLKKERVSGVGVEVEQAGLPWPDLLMRKCKGRCVWNTRSAKVSRAPALGESGARCYDFIVIQRTVIICC